MKISSLTWRPSWYCLGVPPQSECGCCQLIGLRNLLGAFLDRNPGGRNFFPQIFTFQQVNELIRDHVGPKRVRDRTNDPTVTETPAQPHLQACVQLKLGCFMCSNLVNGFDHVSKASTKGELKLPSGEVEIQMNTKHQLVHFSWHSRPNRWLQEAGLGTTGFLIQLQFPSRNWKVGTGSRSYMLRYPGHCWGALQNGTNPKSRQ